MPSLASRINQPNPCRGCHLTILVTRVACKKALLESKSYFRDSFTLLSTDCMPSTSWPPRLSSFSTEYHLALTLLSCPFFRPVFLSVFCPRNNLHKRRHPPATCFYKVANGQFRELAYRREKQLKREAKQQASTHCQLEVELPNPKLVDELVSEQRIHWQKLARQFVEKMPVTFKGFLLWLAYMAGTVG
jgi:hypothetical protein